MPIYSDDDFRKLCDRAKTAWTVAEYEHSSLREVYRWLWPERYYEMVSGPSSLGQGNAAGDRARFDHIFDPTGMQALEDGAAQVAEVIHPYDQEWARWVPRAGLREDVQPQVNDLAAGFTSKAMDALSRSNFHTEAAASHRDFLIGTGFLALETDTREPAKIMATSVPAYRMACECDAAGRWTGFFRKYAPRARDLEAMFGKGAEFSTASSKAMRDEPESRISIEYGWTWDHAGKQWASCAWETEQKHKIVESEHRTCPIIGYRASRTGGRAWATGPGTRALPDVRVANKVVELILNNAALAVTGMWQAEDDGVLNPGAITLRAGLIVPKASGSDGLTPLEAPGRFDVSQMVLDDLRANIRRALYVTRVAEREMTAEEYRGRLQQQIREMRGMYGQLRNEFVSPVNARTLDLLEQSGEIESAEFEQLLDVKMTGPLAQDANMAEVERLQGSFTVVAGMVGPELAMAALNAHEMVPWVARQMHAKTGMWKSKEEIQQFGAQVQQMAAQMLAQQMAQQGAVQDGGVAQ
jgi:hypothetical protein